MQLGDPVHPNQSGTAIVLMAPNGVASKANIELGDLILTVSGKGDWLCALRARALPLLAATRGPSSLRPKKESGGLCCQPLCCCFSSAHS